MLDFEVKFGKELGLVGLMGAEMFGGHEVLQVIVICEDCEGI